MIDMRILKSFSGWFWLLFLLNGCGISYDWGWYVISPLHPQGQTNIHFLISGLGYTLQLSAIAIFFSILLGLPIALLTLTRHPFPRGLNRIYVECFRSIPILVMLLWVYYGLPVVLDIGITTFWAGVVALAISVASFLFCCLKFSSKILTALSVAKIPNPFGIRKFLP